MEVVKRDGEIVEFDKTKIFNAVSKAFNSSNESKNIERDAKKITNDVIRHLNSERNTVEEIQDKVELTLMKDNFYSTAKKYILYREERNKVRSPKTSKELKEKFEKSSQYFENDPMREFVYFRTYSRWIEKEGRRECWEETVTRYMDFMRENLEDKLSEEEYDELFQAILKQEVMPSMRLLQFSGPASRRCNATVYNCAYSAPECFKDLADIMYLLMSGCGVGFSVESYHIEKFPTICFLKEPKIVHEFCIDDSKEGWCEAFNFGLEKWFSGEDVKFDYSKLRPLGARLKTMGGRSSGPAPLVDLMETSRNMIAKRAGHKLTCLQMYDIICKIGQIVISGGIRRSATLSLSDLNNLEMRDSKKGAFWNNHPQRSMANNSAVYKEKPSMTEFMSEWLALAESGTGERGIFNRGGLEKTLPERRKGIVGENIQHMGVNPCLTADTWVLTRFGPKQVSDLIGKKVDLIVNGEVYPMESCGFFSTGIKKVFEIKTKSGNSIKATANHRFLSKNGWTKVEDLRSNDQLILSNHRKLVSWQGAGTFEKGEEFGRNIKKIKRHVEIMSKTTEENTLVKGTSSDFQRGYLRGFSIKNGKLRDDCIYLHDKNRTRLEYIKRILSNFGVQSTLLLKDLEISKDNLDQFMKVIGDEMIFENLEPENFLDEILSIEEFGNEHVYDVTVSKVHEFCANGFRSHNCGEILLQPMCFCNLTEVVCRPTDDLFSLMRKAKLATILGTYQASLTKFNYISEKWKENQEKERLLGVSLTGQYDCETVRNPYVLQSLKNHCLEVNETYSKRFGINLSASVTCTKPSGTVSQMVNSSSGIHPRFSKYYIRRIRISSTDPLLKLMRDQGYLCCPEVGQNEDDATTFVLNFPTKSPEKAICVKDVDAIEQLEYWKTVKRSFTEHNPSVTIYVKEDEWLTVAQWVWENWDYVIGISFLPYSDHVYQLAPYESITKEQYEEMLQKIKRVEFSELVHYEKSDTTDVKRQAACVGGACELN